jgi:glucose/arabinose dehydrogenase
MTRSRSRPAWLAAAALCLLPAPARATLATQGFRAVGVAHAAYPISALAVAPDGRLFTAVQARGQTFGAAPGQAEIRVYAGYASGDGATLDEGRLWATVEGVRATTGEEGLLGIALAPDFATSKLVYVYLTTTDEGANQHVRVYRENAAGDGQLLGTVATSLEPPADGSARNGGPIVFGADGCLFVAVGDHGSSERWNAQLLAGTTPVPSSESSSLCTNVCLGPSLYPGRPASNAALNHAGKILRLAVEGASPAQPGPAAPLGGQPFVFGAGLRNPSGLAVHPLTGQLWAADRGDTQQPEIGVVDAGTNHGWPCLEGGVAAGSGAAACLVGHAPGDVYQNHPDWRRPLATHAANPVASGLAAYTGLAYPEAYFGDVFYLLRDSARIYRIDLDPPCFLPHPNGVVPVAFHDSTNDGDFSVIYDLDGDEELDTVTLTTLTAIAQGPDPLGRQVLYVAGKQGNSSAQTEDSVVFRIEYATAFTPYAGPAGRVPDACFTDGVYSGGGAGAPPYGYENPFRRDTCLPPGGPCPGQPDGTPCDDGDPCNGADACLAGICRHGTPQADGTPCAGAVPCAAGGTCQAGRCVSPGPAPEGTPCSDGDPCNGREVCGAGSCRPGSGPAPLAVEALTVRRDPSGTNGRLALVASFRPTAPLAPHATDAVGLELRDAAGALFAATLEHPASDPFWRRPRGGVFQYRDPTGRSGGLVSVALRPRRGGLVQIDVRARRLRLGRLAPDVGPRLVIGEQCFATSSAGRCSGGASALRCRRRR